MQYLMLHQFQLLNLLQFHNIAFSLLLTFVNFLLQYSDAQTMLLFVFVEPWLSIVVSLTSAFCSLFSSLSCKAANTRRNFAAFTLSAFA